MITYTKKFNDLNDREKASFLHLSEQDPCMPNILKNIGEDAPLDVQVAFAREGRDSVVAVDYSIFDPYHNYIDAYTGVDGWTNFFFENYDADAEVEDENHLPVAWKNRCIEEKEHLVRVLNETFDFPQYEDSESAAAALRQDYENNPTNFWSAEEIEDVDEFEEDVREMISRMYFNHVSCDLDYADLLVQAEGGRDGWYHPVWAKIVEDEDGDYIELSLGDQVFGNTSFFEGDVHTQPNSLVGGIPTWQRHWKEDDAEEWAEECHCRPEDFDCDENMREEAKMRIDEGRFDEDIEAMKQNIIEFAKSKGYNEVYFY